MVDSACHQSWRDKNDATSQVRYWLEGKPTQAASGQDRETARRKMKDMFLHHYILNEKGTPVIEPDLLTWAKWFEKSERHIGLTCIGPYKISTVFLGLDHNYRHEGPPVLWETMVFKKKKTKNKNWTLDDCLDLAQDRCAGSIEQAEAMHNQMVKRVKTDMNKRKASK
jgi:hypothetical protein